MGFSTGIIINMRKYDNNTYATVLELSFTFTDFLLFIGVESTGIEIRLQTFINQMVRNVVVALMDMNLTTDPEFNLN